MRPNTLILAFLALICSLVAAASPPRGLNARRLARGLGPLPPVRRSPTHVALAARQQPSAAPQCNTGEVQCCDNTTTSTDPVVGLLLGLLGGVLPVVTELVGLGCTPTILGLGGNSCGGTTLCCTNNNFNGLIALGCIPINISL